MSVFLNKTRKRWVYDFCLNGERHQGYCVDPKTGAPAKNKSEARSVEDIIRGKLKAGVKAEAAMPPAAGFSLAEPFAFYLKKMQGKADFKNVQTHIKEMIGYFGASTDMEDIDEIRMLEYRQWSQRQRKKIYAGVVDGKKVYRNSSALRAPKTVNSYIQTLVRAYTAFRMAPENKHLRHLIPLPPEVEYLDVPKHVPRPIPQETSRKIIALGFTDENRHLKRAYILAVQTGMREKECAKVRDGQYDDIERVITLLPDQTKARAGRFIPVNDLAREVILECRREGDILWAALQEDPALAAHYADVYGIQRREDINLILYRPKGHGLPRPVKNIANSGWKNMKKKHAIAHRWHDTRAAFCTNALRSSDIETVRKLAGHESILTTQKYLEAADPQKIEAVKRLASNYPVGLPTESLTKVPDIRTKKKPRRA